MYNFDISHQFTQLWKLIMPANPRFRSSVILSTSFVALCCSAQKGVCQASNDVADLVVSGRVVDVFRSGSSDAESLVQILVQKSEATNLADVGRSVRFPAPGEYVYAHVATVGRAAGLLPRPKSNIRATLHVDERHQWTGRGRSWFQDEGESGVSGDSDGEFGVETKQFSLKFRRALKVTAVEADSPAARAGLEVGDVLVSANGEDVSSPAELAEQVRNSRGALKLTVRDVRTDRNVPIEVDLTSQGKASRSTIRRANRASGLKTEIAFFRGNAVLKIIDVTAGSAAKQAGIQPGLLILTANGDTVDKPETLANVEANSNGRLTLKVYDPKSREENTVRVDLR